MRRIAALLLCTLLFGGWSHGRAPQTYYVSNAGNDSNNGLTPTTAWATPGKVAASSFNSGDTVAFDGGSTFSAGMTLSQANAPGDLTLTSFNAGKPTFNTGVNACITATFLPDIRINNLHCVGAGASVTSDGIFIVNPETTSFLIAGPTITNNTVSNYLGVQAAAFPCCVCIEVRGTGSSGHAGFEALTISGNTVSGCTNGINVFHDVTTSALAFVDATVSGNNVNNNPGQNRSDGNVTGFGILFENATNGTVTGNLIHDNGANSNNNGAAGPVGIIFANVNNSVMSFNESYNQQRIVAGDGEGLDFDVGTTNSIMEYNYSHNNIFTELLLFPGGSGNTVRFNVVEATKSNVSGIQIGHVGTTSVYNNTFNMTGSGDCWIGGAVGATYTLANNICRSSVSPLIISLNNTGGGTVTVTGNDYFSNGTPSISLQGTTYTSLGAMQAAGFEKPGGTPSGTTADPNLNGTFPGATCGGYVPPCPAAYELSNATPAGKGNGLNLNTLYSYNVGTIDFYGNAITNATLPIGAAANLPVYSGPGDVVPSATFWYGLRAYSTAKAGNPAINVCNVGDVVCADMSTSATTGKLVVTTIGGSDCSVVVCTIKKFYDQTQGGLCSGSCDVVQNTIASRPTLVVNCVNSQPCANFGGSNINLVSAGAVTSSIFQPFTWTFFAERNGGFTGQQTVLTENVNVSLDFQNLANTVNENAGNDANAAAADSTFHSVLGIANGASSSLTVDGATTSPLNAGSNSFSTTTVKLGRGSGETHNFRFAETGIWGIAFNSTQLSDMARTQAAFW